MFDIYLSSPDVGALEQEYVQRALASGWVAPAGPDLTAFEEEVASRAGRRHAVGLSSGTAALHLALVSWGIGPGDVVPTSTLTFAATANAIRYVGAEPFFVDVDADTGNISPALLRQALDQLHKQGARVPVVLPVDLLGKVADHEAIWSVVADRGIRVLSDAAESFGSLRAGRPSGGFGHAAAISFNGNKIMTTSGGGVLVTDDEVLASHVRKLSTQAREPVPYYEHTEIGYNYRLSNILAALGRAQLARLDGILKRRREIRETYRDFFDSWPHARVLGGADDEGDNCWLTAVLVDANSPVAAADLHQALTAARIESRPIWKPMHRQPVYSDAQCLTDGTADRLFDRGLTLPSGSSMSADDVNRVLMVMAEATGI